MAYKNTATKAVIRAIDTVTNLGKTGDGGNFTIRGVGDAAEYTPATPNVTEIDATNLPGWYSVDLAAGENNYSRNFVGGKSSTVNIVLISYQWENETNANAIQFAGQAITAGAGVTIPTSIAGSSDLTAVKAKTDKLTFDGSNFVKSVQQYTTFAVVADANNGVSNFKTDLTNAADNVWKEIWIQFTSGALNNEARRCTSYNGTTKFIGVSLPYTGTPAPGDTGKIINGGL